LTRGFIRHLGKQRSVPKSAPEEKGAEKIHMNYNERNLFIKILHFNETSIRSSRLTVNLHQSSIDIKTTNIMVAVVPMNQNAVQGEVTKALSPKQMKRMEEQKAREAKKMAKRQEKAMQKERKAADKLRKEEERERKMEELRLEKKGKTPKELEEERRLAEEKELLEKEFFEENQKVPEKHVKKSAFDSDRLGGTHMA
jgi:hypothetical protein